MLQTVDIIRYSGLHIDSIKKNIPDVKNKSYQLLTDSLSGDAPKHFIKIYEYDKEIFPNRKHWVKYIAKVGHKWYPNESVSEYLMNRIGVVLGLKMAKSKLVIINGQIRFLSRYFLLNNEVLVHGAEVFADYLNDEQIVEDIENNALARDFFTFEFTCDALKSVFPNHYELLIQDFVKLLVFDAIVGNNDRHMYNWGVIRNVQKTHKVVFAPIYDTARGLFWNKSEENISLPSYSLEKYIQKSLPKTGLNQIENINHFSLIEGIYQKYPQHQSTIVAMLNPINVDNVRCMIEIEFSKLFSEKRLQMIQKCIDIRFSKLLSVIT